MYKFIERLFLKIISILFIIVLFVSCYSAQAQEIDKKSYLKGVTFFTGYAQSREKLTGKDYYKIVPFIVRLAVDVDKMGIGLSDIVSVVADKGFGKPDFKIKAGTEFLIEPFLNTVVSPDNNLEVGFDILMKIFYPVTEKVQPYVFVGGGVLFMTQHSLEQSTQYNFIPQMGGGVSYYFKENVAVNFEYRYRHLSNANLELPNDGINMNMVLVGLTYNF